MQMISKLCAPAMLRPSGFEAALLLMTIFLDGYQITSANNIKASQYFANPKVAALAEAANQGKIDGIRRSIKEGVNVNTVGKDGVTPLLFVLSNSHNKDGMKALLNAGADPNYMAPNGGCAVILAAGAEDIEILQIMLDGGGNPNLRNKDGEPSTFTAIRQHRWNNLMLLLDRGADINAANSTGDTALHQLADLGFWEQVGKLIERGANYNATTSIGGTVAWRLYRTHYAPGAPEYNWAQKVKNMLVARGVHFPPLSPKENREKRRPDTSL
jgi:uncharacterized protein